MSTNGIDKFKGDRLQRAIDARRWSVSDLSEYTGISAPMIYHMLNDKRKPSYETLQQIATSTNFPVSYFLKDFKHEVAHPFFRKFTRSTKKRRISVEMQLDWLIEITNFLESYIEFPKLDLPIFEVQKEKTPLQLTPSDIEALAQEMRDYWKLGSSVIPNITNVLENNGVFITKFMFETSDIDALSKFETFRKNAFIVLSNDKSQKSRTRFDLAHELAHFVLHRSLNNSDIDLAEKETHKLLEKQANRFAGAFLLPQSSFATDFNYPTLESFKNLKVKYGVSISFLTYRAKQLKLINDRTYRNLQINISRKKWRTTEPLEAQIPHEEPTILKRSLDLVFSEGLFTVGGFENEVGLTSSDIERVCGLENGYLKKYRKSSDNGPKLRLAK